MASHFGRKRGKTACPGTPPKHQKLREGRVLNAKDDQPAGKTRGPRQGTMVKRRKGRNPGGTQPSKRQPVQREKKGGGAKEALAGRGKERKKNNPRGALLGLEGQKGKGISKEILKLP